MRKTILICLVFLSLTVIFIRFMFDPLTKVLGYPTIAGLKVTAAPEAVVYLNGKSLGRTPLENDNLADGEYFLKLESSQGSWQGQVRLNKGTITLVNRELALNIASSSGEVLTLVPGSGIVVTSNPDGASLEIDGKQVGITPFSISTLLPGEHDFILSKDSFLKRDVRAKLPSEMALHLDVDLAVTEADLGAVGEPTTTASDKATVNNTPTGFLRIRSQPSISSKQLTAVKSGTTLTLLTDLGSWLKVETPNGVVGYVSATYVTR